MKQKFKGIKVEELERAYEKALVWFFAFPRTKIGLTELALSIKSSKSATKQAVETLIRREYITREIAGRAWILLANQKNSYFLRKKVPYHFDKIYEVGIVEAVQKAIPQARAIVLFGSYRWGDDTEESDIDIAVEVLDDHNMEIVKLGTLEQLGYRKNIPVNVHIFSRNKIDLNLFANIANGIVLDGFLEVRP
ncbi:nucleotidyltransferase domain-containing protein [Candidatus Woesearchaeota archaeon]|nr:nucleotidyltransferase domain-containing protein [Candidatus Woesearchaeota archaeon]